MPQSQLIAITPGDPCGIGPEIIARAFLNQDSQQVTRHCFVAGDLGVMQKAAQLVDPGGHQLKVTRISQASDVLALGSGVLPVLQVATLDADLPWGQIDARAGRFAGECVFWAAQAALQNQIAAFVTAPLHKEALSAAGAPFDAFPGHTELLQAEAARQRGVPLSQMPVRMMLANDELRTVLVSIHVSLRQALEAVTYDNVLESLRITHQSLSLLLGRPPQNWCGRAQPPCG